MNQVEVGCAASVLGLVKSSINHYLNGDLWEAGKDLGTALAGYDEGYGYFESSNEESNRLLRNYIQGFHPFSRFVLSHGDLARLAGECGERNAELILIAASL